MRIRADDDEGRERLVRYCARPPFALERIEEMKDGRIAYRMKTPRRESTHRVMTPMEFMARLSILVPPPYYPLVRYHGVFAARSSWRAIVTPKPPDGVVRSKKAKPCAEPDAAPIAATSPSPSPAPGTSTPEPSLAHAEPVASDEPTVLTVKHWHRLLAGELFAMSSRIEWAVLLNRTHGLEIYWS